MSRVVSQYDFDEMSPTASMRLAREGRLHGALTITHDGSDILIRHKAVGDAYLESLNGPAMSTGANPIIQAEAGIALILKPFGPVIDKLPNPVYYKMFTTDLKKRPISALVNLLTPIENLMNDSVTAANRISGVKVRRVGLPGLPQADVKMGLDMPVGMSRTATEYVRRLKLVLNVMILGYQDPVSLARGIAETLGLALKKGVKDAIGVADGIIKVARGSGVSLGAAPLVAAPTGKFLKAMLDALKKEMPTLPAFGAAAAATKAVADALAAYALLASKTTAPLLAAIVDRDRQMADVFLPGDRVIKDAKAARALSPASMDRVVAAVETIKRNANTLVAKRDGYRGPGGAPRLVYLTAEAVKMGFPATRLAGYLGEAAAATTAASGAATAAGAGEGVASAGVTAEATAPATTPGIAALIGTVIAYAVEHPEQIDAVIKLATEATGTASELAKKEAQDHAEATKEKAQDLAPLPPAAPSGGFPFLPAVLAAGAAVALPVVGPIVALPLAAGAAYAALKKKSPLSGFGAAAAAPPPVFDNTPQINSLITGLFLKAQDGDMGALNELMRLSSNTREASHLAATRAVKELTSRAAAAAPPPSNVPAPPMEQGLSNGAKIGIGFGVAAILAYAVSKSPE